MRKIIFFILILALLLPAAALADYSPALRMTMADYIKTYNAISAPISSPYQLLEKPYRTTTYEDYNVYWFKPAKDSSVTILLMSKDQSAVSLNGGLDIIQIFTENSKDLISLISVAQRCAEPLSQSLFGLSVGQVRVAQVLRFYYESNAQASGNSAYWSLDEDTGSVMAFFTSGNQYYFQISLAEDV